MPRPTDTEMQWSCWMSTCSHELKRAEDMLLNTDARDHIRGMRIIQAQGQR